MYALCQPTLPLCTVFLIHCFVRNASSSPINRHERIISLMVLSENAKVCLREHSTVVSNHPPIPISRGSRATSQWLIMFVAMKFRHRYSAFSFHFFPAEKVMYWNAITVVIGTSFVVARLIHVSLLLSCDIDEFPWKYKYEDCANSLRCLDLVYYQNTKKYLFFSTRFHVFHCFVIVIPWVSFRDFQRMPPYARLNEGCNQNSMD